MVFAERDWRAGVEGVDEGLVERVKTAALDVSFYLPSKPSDEDLLTFKPYLGHLERGLTLLRQLSTKPAAFPAADISPPELALWAIGLAQYLRTMR